MMRTAAFSMRQTSGARRIVDDRAGPRGPRIALAAAAACVLHAGVLMLLAREPAVRSVPVQRQVMVAMLIAPPPAVSPMAASATQSKAASRAMQRAASVSRSPASAKSSAIKPAASDRTRPPSHDASAPSRPAPSATADERRDTPRDDATPDATHTQAQLPASPAPATPRFVARPECALPPPDYPPQSLRTGEHGTALVELETDASGRVVAARVVAGSGYPRLDAAARDAVLASRCATHAENGAPSPIRARVPITFNLDE
ncbi:hypothetical protein CFB46_16710 [Burkholderia sp. HI2761]|nr:TonB family protein [Burkholderia sp. BE24]OXJ25183.1 hypothetical protein CFB46_16710 [Burkholderia sp. HI2761]